MIFVYERGALFVCITMFYFHNFLDSWNRFVASFDSGVNSMKTLYLLGNFSFSLSLQLRLLPSHF